MAEHQRRRPRWLFGTGALAAVALVLGAGYAAARSTSEGSPYRIATVSGGPVTQVVTLAGTAQPVNKVLVTFPASGTVTSVKVRVGQHVTEGQTLATQDPTTLTAALRAAEATLAQDRATLAADEATTTTTSTSSTASSGSAGSSASGSAVSTATRSSSMTRAAGVPSSSPTVGVGGKTATRSSGSLPKVPASDAALAEQLVSSAQRAMYAARQVCAPVSATFSSGPPSGSRPGPIPTASPTSATPTDNPTSEPSAPPTTEPTTTPTSERTTPPPSGSTEPTPTPTGAAGTSSSDGTQSGPTPAQVRACVAALSAVGDSQAKAEAALSRLVGEVGRVLSAVAQAAESAAASAAGSAAGGTRGTSTATQGGGAAARASAPSTSAGSPSGSAQRAANPAGGQGAGATSASSLAVRLDADRSAILQDQASVTQAQADVAGATLKAPFSGVVGQVGLTSGQSASTGTGILLLGPGAVRVSVDVPLADMSLIRSGLAAQVTPSGGVTASPAYVESVGLLPASTNTSSPTYPASILVSDPPTAMAAGSPVTVSITVATVPSAVRVPVSALSGTVAGTATATLLPGGTTTRVEVGAIGGGWAQILRGLTAGQQVVVADRRVPLPSNGFAALRGLRTGGGGFGPGGFSRGAGTSNGRTTGPRGG